MKEHPYIPKHPIQPLVPDSNGTMCFKENKIVTALLAQPGGWDLNALAHMPFEQEDRVQFAQLIGYSLGGFGELSYVPDTVYEAAVMMHNNGITEEQARIAHLEGTLQLLATGLRAPIALLYDLEEDELTYNRQHIRQPEMKAPNIPEEHKNQSFGMWSAYSQPPTPPTVEQAKRLAEPPRPVEDTEALLKTYAQWHTFPNGVTVMVGK